MEDETFSQKIIPQQRESHHIFEPFSLLVQETHSQLLYFLQQCIVYWGYIGLNPSYLGVSPKSLDKFDLKIEMEI